MAIDGDISLEGAEFAEEALSASQLVDQAKEAELQAKAELLEIDADELEFSTLLDEVSTRLRVVENARSDLVFSDKRRRQDLMQTVLDDLVSDEPQIDRHVGLALIQNRGEFKDLDPVRRRLLKIDRMIEAGGDIPLISIRRISRKAPLEVNIMTTNGQVRPATDNASIISATPTELSSLAIDCVRPSGQPIAVPIPDFDSNRFAISPDEVTDLKLTSPTGSNIDLLGEDTIKKFFQEIMGRGLRDSVWLDPEHVAGLFVHIMADTDIRLEVDPEVSTRWENELHKQFSDYMRDAFVRTKNWENPAYENTQAQLLRKAARVYDWQLAKRVRKSIQKLTTEAVNPVLLQPTFQELFRDFLSIELDLNRAELQYSVDSPEED